MPTARIIYTTTGDVQLLHLKTAVEARRELARELARRKGLDNVHKSDNI